MRNVSMRSASLDARQDADIRCRARAVGDDMRGTLPAECLALTTGIFPKKPPSVADVARALKLHKRVESAIIEFLAEGKPQRFEWTRPPQQEELHMDLVTPVDGLSWQAEHLPLEVLPQWLMVVNQARKYCADKWPIYNADGLQPANYALADDELGDIWELVRAVDGIDAFFSDLKSSTLSPAMVAAVQSCFPDYYETVKTISFDALAGFLAKKKTITPAQEDMIRVLLQIPDEAPITVTQAPQTPTTTKPKKPTKSANEKLATASRTRQEAYEAQQQQASK
jgi:hypothetical protein